VLDYGQRAARVIRWRGPPIATFSERHLAPEFRDSVVPPPLVVLARHRPAVRFLDQPFVEHELEVTIEVAWLEFEAGSRPLTDVLHDGVAVPFPARNESST
jgi:hypothetical protein